MTRTDIDNYQRVLSQLEAFHREFEGLTKKTANSPLNSFKLKIVNQAIVEANGILGTQFIPIRGFDKFNDEEIPTNSDVSMVLAQYLEAMEVFRCRHIKQDTIGRWIWKVEGSQVGDISTARPRRSMSLDSD